MIVNTIKEAAERRGIEKPYHLAVKAEISTSKASALWNKERLPDLTTLDTLCKVLRCQIGSLVRYEPDAPAKPTNGKKR